MIESGTIAALVSAGGAALGQRLRAPVVLTGGSDRSAVLRCQSELSGPVIIKAHPASADGRAAFATEAAGLAFTSGHGIGPDLLAADPAEQLVVMTDLGDSPSLADLLLGTDTDLAGATLLSWASACGDLAVLTAGGQQRFAELRQQYLAGTPVAGRQPHWLERRIGQIPDLLADLSFAVPSGLGAELAEVAAITRPSGFEVFSPGDICPDNNLITKAGVRFIDFESAEFHSVFLDAAYLRMPFSSCWCVFRLPAELAARAESAYRDRVAGIFPQLADDTIWEAGLRRALTAWTMHAMTYLLDKSAIADGSMNGAAVTAPTARQLLRYRWEQLRAELAAADELPAVRALMTELLVGTRGWQAPELPCYPAFGKLPGRPESWTARQQ